MPPKVRVTKEDILRTAFEILRSEGVSALNARSIATALDCSTQPIFSNFASMDELQETLLGVAYEHYLNFLQQEAASGKYPMYKAFGMAYIRFARDERELFKYLFMCDRKGEARTPTKDYEDSVAYIVKNSGISQEKAELMHLEMWACVHGIATMGATSFLQLDEELVNVMLTDAYQGLLARHTKEDARS